jgi:hypothetical protein
MEIRGELQRAIGVPAALALLLSAAGLVSPIRLPAQGSGTAQVWKTPSKLQDDLAAFLSAPIDLGAFKRKKGQSNNGAFKAPREFYRPAGAGFFYQYMLFDSPHRYNESERFGGFSVVVYKFGRVVGDFYDTNETLVAIWCQLNDPDLGAANLVETRESAVKARFGEPFAIIQDVWVYQRDGRAVSMQMTGGAVAWFKYARLSHALGTPDAVPKWLLHPGPGW